MPLYLMRHGEAAEGDDDAARPLTLAGLAAVRDVARQAASRGVQLDRVFHSGLLRAEQTAQLLAEELKLPSAIEPHDGLLPDDDPEPTARWLFEEVAARSLESL